MKAEFYLGLQNVYVTESAVQWGPAWLGALSSHLLLSVIHEVSSQSKPTAQCAQNVSSIFLKGYI